MSSSDRCTPLFVLAQETDKVFLLFCGYCFFCTLGSFARISSGVSTIGITSVLLVCIVALRLPKTIQVIRRHPILWLWLVLLCYIFGTTLINYGEISFSIWAYRKIGSLLLYILFAGAVASIEWNKEKIYLVACFIACGLLISASFCFIDGLGIVDIPRVNDSAALQTELNSFHPYGNFRHRSVLSLYMAVFLSFLFVYVDSKKVGTVLRYSTLTAGLYFVALLIYSRNRSGPAAMVICFTAYYFLSFNNRRKFNLRRIPDFFIILAIAIGIVAICKPNIMNYYFMQWMSTPGINKVARSFKAMQEDPDFKVFWEDRSKVIQKSDMFRVNLAKESLSQVFSNPFGKGFKNDTHVFFVVDIVFAAGMIGIIWLFFYCSYLIRYLAILFRKSDQFIEKRALVSSLSAWLLVGLMYNSSQMGIAWGFFGITVCLAEKSMDFQIHKTTASHTVKVVLGRL